MVQPGRQNIRQLTTIAALTGASLLPVLPSHAQLLPDNSLGEERSVVAPGVDSTGQPADVIRGGARRGGNLFHSFQDFNVGDLQRVYFTNPEGVSNILSRVTGSDRSSILGRLGVLGDANLFLMNPNGIIFGPNASLDIRGSFVASTASSIRFADSVAFSAVDPSAPPLLTVSVPIGLQYGSNPGALQVQGATLEMLSEQTLALIGGDVTINGGRLFVPGGRIELAGVAAGGAVDLVTHSSPLVFSFPAATLRADVAIMNGSRVGVFAGDGGDIAINARDLNMSGESIIRAGIASGMGSIDAQAGNIEINATQAINLDFSSVDNIVQEGGVGTGGDIFVTTGSLSVTDGAAIGSGTGGAGDAGDVVVNARDAVTMDGVSRDGFSNSAIASAVAPTGNGDAGNVTITAASLSATGGAGLTSSTAGEGNGGNVTINTRDTVRLHGIGSNEASSGVYSQVFPAGLTIDLGGDTATAASRGNGGNITITTGSLSVTGGARIDSSTGGAGNAGNVIIYARDTVHFNGVGTDGFSSGAFSAVGDNATGNGGEITITTRALSVTEGAALFADTLGEGNGGNIRIRTEALSIAGGATLNNSTSGEGNAGDVRINARNSVRIDDSSLFSAVGENGRGNGGNIRITTGSLSLFNGAQLQTRTEGEGNSGNIRIVAYETVLFSRGGGSNRERASGIVNTVGANAVGNGGEITIRSPRLILRSNAAINADAGSIRGVARQGQGGDVNLNISGTLSIRGEEPAPTGESARITLALTPDGIGSGGNLTIRARVLELRNGGLIKVSTQGQGDAGDVSVNAGTVNISGSVPSSGLPSGIFTSSTTAGNAGDITIETRSFRIADGAALSARSRGDGRGGNIEVNADRSFEAVNGGQLIITTFGEGRAGNISVDAAEQITIAGRDPDYDARLSRFPNPISGFVANDIRETGSASGLYANTEPDSAGRGGNIRMSAGAIAIQDSAGVIATSEGLSSAGNIELLASTIRLDDRARVESDTTGNQGNVTLQADVLTLHDNSRITTNAEGTGTGGNINVDADFIVAFPNENNDIIANAEQGSGGQITLTTQGIFGFDIRTREQLQRLLNTTNSDELDPGNLPTNDITAFSQANPTIDTGTVTVQSPDLDPTQGLTALPTDLSDPTQLIAATCPADEGSSFAITGRGGLPEDPRQPLMGQEIWQDERDTGNAGEDRNVGDVEEDREAIVEAQSWIVDRRGQVVLVAQQLQQSAPLSYPSCALSSSSP
ncbi:MAG: hypothetical protein Kow00121_59010 [Elainellaceae cyanobacterium]